MLSLEPRASRPRWPCRKVVIPTTLRLPSLARFGCCELVPARRYAPSGADAIRNAFAGYASASEGWFRGRGCLMCNTAVERAALDSGSRRYVDAYLDRLTRAFRHALSNAQRAGDIRNVADLAAFFTTALIGVAACIRAEAPPRQLRAASTVATSILDAYLPATQR